MNKSLLIYGGIGFGGFLTLALVLLFIALNITNESYSPSMNFTFENTARLNEISSIFPNIQNINSKEKKLSERGFSGLPEDSPLLDDSVNFKYNKIISDFPRRVEFMEALALDSSSSLDSGITGNAISSENSDALLNFLELNKPVFGINTENLRLDSEEGKENFSVISYKQEYKGLLLYNSRIYFMINSKKLSVLGIDYVSVENLEATPSVSEEGAKRLIYSSYGKIDLNNATLLIYPKLTSEGLNPFLAWHFVSEPFYALSPSAEKDDSGKVFIETKKKLSKYEFFVNAHDGEVLDSFDLMREESFSGNSYGDVFPDHFKQEKIIVNLSNQKIMYDSEDEDFIMTNQDGKFYFDEIPTEDIKGFMTGPYVKVVDYSNDSSEYFGEINPASENFFNWSNLDYSYKREATNVFYHSNLIHDYFTKGGYPRNNSGLDFEMRAEINDNPNCNAYASGDTIHFYQPVKDQCETLSLSSDVIYHEYTHNLVFILAPMLSSVYWGQTGNMNEGYADYFACSTNNQSCLSDNFFYGYGMKCLRNCKNNQTYPKDYDDEPHSAAEIISGSLWDLREKTGKEIADNLALLALAQDPQSFQELLDAVLFSSESFYGDGNFTNGVKYGEEICNSFYSNHGIYSDYCMDILPLWGILYTEGYSDKPSINIIGSAGGKNFSSYEVYYLFEEEREKHDWKLICASQEKVLNSSLCPQWNLSSLSDGGYSIKLVVKGDGLSVESEKEFLLDRFKITYPQKNLYSLYLDIPELNKPEYVSAFLIGSKPVDIQGRVPSGENYKLVLTGYNPEKEETFLYEGVSSSDEIFNLGTMDKSIFNFTREKVYMLNLFVGNFSEPQDEVILLVDTRIYEGWPVEIPIYYGSEDDLEMRDKFSYISNSSFYSTLNYRSSLPNFEGKKYLDSSEINDSFEVRNIKLGGLGLREKVFYWQGLTEPVVEDLDGDSVKDIFVVVAGNPVKVYGFDIHGNSLKGWPVNLTGVNLPGGNIEKPSATDFDMDGFSDLVIRGEREIFVINYLGEEIFKIDFNGYSLANDALPVSIIDLDRDGSNELVSMSDTLDYDRGGRVISIIESKTGKIIKEIDLKDFSCFVFNKNGKEAKWCYIWGYRGRLPPMMTFGQFDSDKDYEIVVLSKYAKLNDLLDPDSFYFAVKVNVFNADGSSIEGFPSEIDSEFGFTNVLVYDTDKDGFDEIFFGIERGRYIEEKNSVDYSEAGWWGIDSDGSVIEGFPKYKGTYIDGIGGYLTDKNSLVFNRWYNSLFDYNFKEDSINESYFYDEEAINLNLFSNKEENYFSEYGSDFNIYNLSSDEKKNMFYSSLRSYSFLLTNSPTFFKQGEDLFVVFSGYTDVTRGLEQLPNIIVYNLSEFGINADELNWPMYQHDPQHTGCYDGCTSKSADFSRIVNKRNETISGKLAVRLEKFSEEQWIEEKTVIDKEISLEKNEEINLAELWNSQDTTINEEGRYRIKVIFSEDSEEGKITEENYEFLVE